MSEIDTELKKWGNSLGIRIPLHLARESGLAEGDKVRVQLEPSRATAASFWGTLPSALPGEDFASWRRAERRRERQAEVRKMKLLGGRPKRGRA